MGEQWKDIKNHPLYEVSNRGHVRRKDTGNQLAVSLKVNHNYAQVYLNIGKTYTTRSVPNLVASHFLENPFNLTLATYINPTRPLDCSIGNVRWSSEHSKKDMLKWLNSNKGDYHEAQRTLLLRSHTKGSTSAYGQLVTMSDALIGIGIYDSKVGPEARNETWGAIYEYLLDKVDKGHFVRCASIKSFIIGTSKFCAKRVAGQFRQNNQYYVSDDQLMRELHQDYDIEKINEKLALL